MTTTSDEISAAELTGIVHMDGRHRLKILDGDEIGLEVNIEDMGSGTEFAVRLVIAGGKGQMHVLLPEFDAIHLATQLNDAATTTERLNAAGLLLRQWLAWGHIPGAD